MLKSTRCSINPERAIKKFKNTRKLCGIDFSHEVGFFLFKINSKFFFIYLGLFRICYTSNWSCWTCIWNNWKKVWKFFLWEKKFCDFLSNFFIFFVFFQTEWSFIPRVCTLRYVLLFIPRVCTLVNVCTLVYTKSTYVS